MITLILGLLDFCDVIWLPWWAYLITLMFDR
jgi:hypothetical protein